MQGDTDSSGWSFRIADFLRCRWAHRKNLRMSARWVLLCFGPGWVLGTVLMSQMFPSIFLSDALAPSQPRRGSARCCVPAAAVFADFVGSGRD